MTTNDRLTRLDRMLGDIAAALHEAREELHAIKAISAPVQMADKEVAA